MELVGESGSAAGGATWRCRVSLPAIDQLGVEWLAEDGTGALRTLSAMRLSRVMAQSAV